jgi:hypothetical protein
MDGNAQKHNRRFRLKGWHLALAALVLLAGSMRVYVAIQRGAVERRLQALRAAGYPTTFAELAEYTSLPDGVENAAGLYESAFEVLVLPADEANVPTLGTAKLPARGVPWPALMTKSVEECLAANQQCLALLHEAAGIEHCRYDYDYAQQEMGPEAEEFWRCVGLLHVAAIYHAYKGETDAAVICLEDSLRLSDSLEREPALLSYLVRISSTGTALGGLQRILSLASLADRQLTQLDNALTRTARTLDFRRVLITERCRLIETCGDPTGLSDSFPDRVLGFRATGLADTLEYMGARIEATNLPPLDRLERFRAIYYEIEQLSFLHTIAPITNSSTARAAQLDARIRTHLDLARTALAIERYRLATAEVPEQLAELVPTHLEHVPVDLFDGQPIRYRRTDPGYLLYSVDTDGQDNGGRERNDKNRDGPYDLCFIVTR